MQLRNQLYIGSNQRKSVYDLAFPEGEIPAIIILFIHGYKGYKDWGAWNLLEKAFVEQGFGFCKFNLSHNGGTIENPIDFPDLEAFANNRYSYELHDVQTMIQLLHDRYPTSKIVLMGHSRGGGDALLASRHPAVVKIVTLAAISSVAYRFRHTKMMEEWKKKGVRYELNSRTQQEMPIYYSQYEDFIANQDLLSIEKACRTLDKPCLHFHGDKDEAILLQEGINIATWTKEPLIILENCNHTFGTAHPWKKEVLSNELQEVVKKVCAFLE